MARDEAARSDLFALLEPTLGRPATTLLMNQIPPESWPEFATKSDLEFLGARFDGRIEVLEQRLAGSTARLDERITGLAATLNEGTAALATTLNERTAVLDERFGRLEAQMGEGEQRVINAFRGELLSTTRHLVVGVVGAVLSTALGVLGAVRYG